MKSSLIIFLLNIVLITDLYSQGWFEENSGVSVQLNCVVSFSFNRAWCCGNSGTVLKRSNVFPALWTNVSGNGIPMGINLTNITCSTGGDSNIALTTGTVSNITYVYRTTNSGANWVQVFSQLNGHINAIQFATSQNTNVFMQGSPVGGRWSLWKSTNSGLTWDSTGLYLPQSGSESGWNNSMYYFQNNIWFGTNNSRIYHSTNSGASWSIQSTSPEINSNAIFNNFGSNVSFAGGSTLLKSTNLGVNWLTNSSMGSGNFGGFASILSYWWYVRSDDKIYISSNNGSSWAVHYTAPAGNYTHLVYVPSNLRIYAVRTNGGISIYQTSIGISQLSSEVPNAFSLSQNYPNPFNPTTNFEFRIAHSGLVKLTIYDVLGREVTTLVNEELKPGTYQADWDASNYTSGVYYYRLTAGDYSETKKMILLK